MKKPVLIAASLVFGLLSLTVMATDSQTVVSFRAEGGGFPPVGEHIEAVCGNGATCTVSLNLLVTGSPYAGEHENVGLFQTKVPKNQVLPRIKALQVALKKIGTISSAPPDAALGMAQMPGAAATWIYGSEKTDPSDDRRKWISDVLFHWNELRYMAASHPVVTSRLGCQGSTIGHEIQLACVIENTGKRTIHLNGILPKDIRMFSFENHGMLSVADAQVYSGKMRQLAGIPPIAPGKTMTFQYRATMHDERSPKQPVTMSLNLVSNEFAALLYSNRIQLK